MSPFSRDWRDRSEGLDSMIAQAPSMPAVPPRPEFAGILRQEETFGHGSRDDSADRLNTWFDNLMVQAGVPLAPRVVLLLCLCAALMIGGTLFVVQEHLLTAALGTLIGFAVPVAVAVLVRSRRQAQILQQFSPMLNELGRAARTGRSVEQCLQLIAADTPLPLGTELRRVARKLQLGASLKEALHDLPWRTGLTTFNLFCMTLTVHQQTGGDLVSVLDRLARAVRDRLLYLGRLKAATAASRATAVLMIAIPPAVLTFFTFREPGYLQTLIDSPWGRNATVLGVVLQIIGSVWVLRILKQSQRG
jgi:tight adherence protein B